MAIGVLSLLAAGFGLVSRTPLQTGVALPEGKVEPYLSNNLLLAPDGTLWKLEHSGNGGPASSTLLPFAAGDDWKQISGWPIAGLAVKQDGTLWGWHKPTAAAAASSPVQIGTDADWTSVRYAGAAVSPIALKSDGTLYSFGHPEPGGQIAFQRFAPDMLPVQIGTDCDWAAIEAGPMTYCALKDDGTLWHWGWLSTHGPRHNPSRVAPDTDWRSLGGGGMLVAIKGEGSIWIRESLRTGHEKYVPSLQGWRSIATKGRWHTVVSGGYSIAARHEDGSWHVWGNNAYGRIGMPKASRTSLPGGGRSLPFEEPRIERLTKLEIGLDIWAWSLESQSILLARDGVLYCMGGIPGKKAGPIEKLKMSVNMACYRIGVRQPFDTSAGPFRHKPVRIGELPASVISSLRHPR